ncbi:BTB/POZ domain-containing protein 6-like [Neocloeon triangulifer]|uniref:BTB/POZ domain-containing protein 6-like n=1 Tax=Neocloeon triangulifer TaxID=2078957 RepID=UPI00286ED4E8|nr:BTB/POZ domain-containing protein 6-like [Neocloeon triangulifer]
MDQADIAEMNNNLDLLRSGAFSDCTFVVGLDKRTIKAHKVILARNSQIFEKLFSRADAPSRVVLKNIGFDDFLPILRFIYAGGDCIKSVEEACALLKYAEKFQLEGALDKSRAFLWASMYPGRIWSTYRCAIAANDDQLARAAIDLAKQDTAQALQESDFNVVPKEILADFLHSDQLSFVPQSEKSPQRHYLEVKLLKAAIRWAKAEAKRQGLPLNPVSYRTVLGPELLMPLRGLFLTTNDHQSLEFGSKKFDYGKIMALVFNLDEEGDVGQFKGPRLVSEAQRVRKVVGAEFCGPLRYFTGQNSTFSLVSSAQLDFLGMRDPRLVGLQVLRKEGCLQKDEFTVLVVKSAENKIVYGARVIITETGECKKGPQRIEIKFPREVALDGDSSQFKVQIIFHQSGEYPSYDHTAPVDAPKFINANTMVNVKTPKGSGIITSIITTKPRGS